VFADTWLGNFFLTQCRSGSRISIFTAIIAWRNSAELLLQLERVGLAMTLTRIRLV